MKLADYYHKVSSVLKELQLDLEALVMFDDQERSFKRLAIVLEKATGENVEMKSELTFRDPDGREVAYEEEKASGAIVNLSDGFEKKKQELASLKKLMDELRSRPKGTQEDRQKMRSEKLKKLSEYATTHNFRITKYNPKNPEFTEIELKSQSAPASPSTPVKHAVIPAKIPIQTPSKTHVAKHVKHAS